MDLLLLLLIILLIGAFVLGFTIKVFWIVVVVLAVFAVYRLALGPRR